MNYFHSQKVLLLSILYSHIPMPFSLKHWCLKHFNRFCMKDVKDTFDSLMPQIQVISLDLSFSKR